jgi:hypothetical protein
MGYKKLPLLVRSPPPRRWPAVLAAGMATTAGGLSGREPYGNPVTEVAACRAVQAMP